MPNIDFEMFQTLETLKKAFEEKQNKSQSADHGIILIDTPEHAAHVKRLVTGESGLDDIMLIVSAAAGPIPATQAFNKAHDMLLALDHLIIGSPPDEINIPLEMRLEYFPPVKNDTDDTRPLTSGRPTNKPKFRDHDYKGNHPMLRR